MARARGRAGHKSTGKNEVPYTDPENEASKIFIISLRLIRSEERERKLSNLAGRIVKYDPQI